LWIEQEQQQKIGEDGSYALMLYVTLGMKKKGEVAIQSL